MAQAGGNLIDRGTETPLELHNNWFEVARSVYRWTDERKPEVDRAWWRTQTARLYVRETRAPNEPNPHQSVAAEESATAGHPAP